MYEIIFLSPKFVLQNLDAYHGPENTVPSIAYQMINEHKVVGGIRIGRGTKKPVNIILQCHDNSDKQTVSQHVHTSIELNPICSFFCDKLK
jgi:hypothetical protein